MVIGNFSPPLDGEYVPLWACRPFKLKIQVLGHMSFSSTGREAGGGGWSLVLPIHPLRIDYLGLCFNQDAHPDAGSVPTPPQHTQALYTPASLP